MNKRVKDYGLPLLIYLIGLGIVVSFALFDFKLVSDQGREFIVYLLVAETGKWQIVLHHGLLSSCLFTTFFPAMFQRAFSTDLVLTYKLFPCFLMPFLPVVVYYLAKKWVSSFYAFLASGFVIGQIYFMYDLTSSRVMIALVFFVLALLVAFNKDMRFRTKMGLSVLLSACTVTAHYGVTFGSLLMIGEVIVAMAVLKAIWRYSFPSLRAVVGYWVILLVGTIVWLGIINSAPLVYGQSFARQSLGLETSEVVIVDKGSPAKEVETETAGGIPEDVGEVEAEYGFFSLETRSEVIQAAFGKTLDIMNIPQKIEFAFSWMTILLMTWGLVLMTKRWGLREVWVVQMLICYSVIVTWVVLPSAGHTYGIARIYFHMMVVLAPCFIIGGLDVARRLKVRAPLLLMAVLIPYGLCTSGVMHSFWGLSR